MRSAFEKVDSFTRFANLIYRNINHVFVHQGLDATNNVVHVVFHNDAPKVGKCSEASRTHVAKRCSLTKNECCFLAKRRRVSNHCTSNAIIEVHVVAPHTIDFVRRCSIAQHVSFQVKQDTINVFAKLLCIFIARLNARSVGLHRSKWISDNKVSNQTVGNIHLTMTEVPRAAIAKADVVHICRIGLTKNVGNGLVNALTNSVWFSRQLFEFILSRCFVHHIDARILLIPVVENASKLIAILTNGCRIPEAREEHIF